MILQQPIWLLLLIPIGCLLFLWRVPSRFITSVRILALLLILLALAEPALKLPIRSGSVIVVCDKSLSMPENAGESQISAINVLAKNMDKNDRLGVVSFAKTPFPERAPSYGGSFSGFVSESNPDASDLNAALEQAISLIPPGDPARIFVISDGQWTGENPNRLVSRLMQRNIAVDFRLLERTQSGDVAIVALETPENVLPNEVFTINAWIRVPISQEINYELSRNNSVIASGTRGLRMGDERLVFRDKSSKSGTIEYSLKISPVGGNDSVPENNVARRLVGVEGSKPLLLLAEGGLEGVKPAAKLGEIFRKAGIETETKSPSDVNWDLATMSGYSGIVIENTPASEIGTNAMTLIADWIRQSGAGLMLTGGKNAFGTGGYYKSPLDEIMPVSMELRREHRKLAVAVCAVLDTSGSMGASTAGGKIKIDLAKLGAAEIPRVLSPMDEIAVYGYDTLPRVLVDLQKNTAPEKARNQIMQPGSLGGGILAYPALVYCIDKISRASADTKHIIMFADASDTEDPRDYKTLLEKAKKAGITLSCIGLGTKADCHAGLLEDMARIGGGQCYFTNDPMDLPRVFAQDTMIVAKSTFVEEPVQFVFTGAIATLFGETRTLFAVPKIGGYNMTYPKDGSVIAAKTTDEYDAPILASWHAGLGRVICYTGQADGKFTGAIAEWEKYNSLLASLGRWTAGRVDSLPNNMLLTQDVTDGSVQIRLHLDPENEDSVIKTLPSITTLRQSVGQPLVSETIPMRWLEPEMLGATVPLTGSETLLASVTLNDAAGTPSVSLAPVCLPYSPEFRPSELGKGRETLAFLASATNGSERIELTEIWRDIPKVVRSVDITKWLLFTAMLFFMMEIFERRTGWISGWGRRLAIPISVTDIGKTLLNNPRRVFSNPRRVFSNPRGVFSSPRSVFNNPHSVSLENTEAEKTEPKIVEQPQDDMFDALSKAKKAAKHRGV